jgi:hypothetical protein
MDIETTAEQLRAMYSSGDPRALARQLSELAADDLVQDWPQSGERIRGRDNVVAVNEHYEASTGSAPKLTLRRLLPPGAAWIAEATIDYGDGTPISLVSILETGTDGRLSHQTDYFASPFEAPAWRKEWVHSIDAPSVKANEAFADR